MQPGDPAPMAFPAAQITPAMSYAANGNIVPMGNRNLPAFWFAGKITGLAELQAPAQLVLAAHGLGTRPCIAGDDTTSGCTGNESGTTGLPAAQGSSTVYCAARFRHNGGSVYLLADGHAKWYRGPGSWRAQGASVAYRKSLSPNAAAWFRED